MNLSSNHRKPVADPGRLADHVHRHDVRAGSHRVRIAILSDLHLAGQSYAVPPIDADVIVLAGDIDDGCKGVEWANRSFDRPVVYVLGNHEYRGSSIDRRVDECRQAAHAHVHVLERESVELAGVRFLGATLWSDFSLFGSQAQQHHRAVAAQRCADFRLIRSADGQAYSVDDAEAIHRATAEWLDQQLDAANTTIVVTHHAPSSLSIPARLLDAPLVATYATDLTKLVGKAGLWIHGHVHDSSDYELGGTRVICNPRGGARDSGAGEAMNDRFQCPLTVSLEWGADSSAGVA